MGIKNNIKEGVRRIWVLCSISITIRMSIGFFMYYSAAVSDNSAIIASPIIVFGIILGAPLACFLIYRIGWLIFQWIYDGFAGTTKNN